MNLKTLVAKERRECKERMIKETSGVYVLIYIWVAFSILMSAMFGFHLEPEEEYMIPITFAAINGFAYDAFTVYVSGVKENGIRTNIFIKYIYTPIETGKLVMAKLLVTARIIAVPVILSQLVAIFIRAINPDNDGGSFADVTVWIPVINGMLYLIYDAIEYKLKCDKANKL